MIATNQNRLRLSYFCLFFALFGLLAISVFFDFGWVSSLDRILQDGIISFRGEPLTAFFTLLTYSGNWQSVTAVCLVFLILPATRRWYGLPMSLSALVSVSCYQLIKHLICRPRPQISLHLISQGGFSFPSGHTLSCVLVWGTCLLLTLRYRKTASDRPLKSQQIGPAARFSPSVFCRPCPGETLSLALFVFCIAYMALMGLSRIYLGVHWPTDVLASYCLGLALLIPISAFIERWIPS